MSIVLIKNDDDDDVSMRCLKAGLLAAIPALIDVDWKLNVASYCFLEQRTVSVVIVLRVDRQFAVIGAHCNLATANHTRRVTQKKEQLNSRAVRKPRRSFRMFITTLRNQNGCQ